MQHTTEYAGNRATANWNNGQTTQPATISTTPAATAKGDLAPSSEPNSAHYHPNVDLHFVCMRQQLLSRLITLSTALEQQHWDLAETLLPQFCEALLGYLTLGHDRAFANRLPNTHLYAAIAGTTRCSLAFYDRFYRGTGSLNIVRNALEPLALALETRFELEDDLYAQLLAA